MIYVLCLDLSGADMEIYGRLYERASAERKKRADTYRRFGDKLRCLAAEALLRKALGASEYRTETNEYGKPYIAGREDFFFSLSHSGNYAVIAWGDTEVGVDIQENKPGTDVKAISDRFFTKNEQAYIDKDEKRFYEIWTKKESYLKYIGTGLHKDMRSFSVLGDHAEYSYHYLMINEKYSLSLCGADEEYTLEYLDVYHFV